MRNNSGFTLIELVIVIVILGILGAVASVKFVQLQADAYRANLNALASSIESTLTLAHTKAILGGYDKDGNPAADDIDFGKVPFLKGYPSADGLIRTLSNPDTFISKTEYGQKDKQPYVYILAFPSGLPAVLIIAPGRRGTAELNATADNKCQLEYQQIQGLPKVEVFGDGC